MKTKILLIIIPVILFGGVIFAQEVRERIQMKAQEELKDIPVLSEDLDNCIQVITYAKNPETEKCEVFPNPCVVPKNWEGCEIKLDETSNQMINKKNEESIETPNETSCEINDMIFYYLDGCGHCQKVKSDGTIDKLKELGVNVKQVNANTGEILHQFQGVPTFVVGGEVYVGYRTLEELKKLLHCK